MKIGGGGGEVTYGGGQSLNPNLVFYTLQHRGEHYRGRILGCNWDKSLKSFPPCYSTTSNGFYSIPLPLNKSSLKLVCNVNIVNGNLKSVNF